MTNRKEHQPGTRAPITGRFEELNIFGSPTGKIEHVREGERLPPSPQGFSGGTSRATPARREVGAINAEPGVWARVRARVTRPTGANR